MQFDLVSPSGKQAFEKWVTALIRNEINSYVRQVLFQRDSTYVDNKTGSGNLTDTERIARLEQAVFRR